MTYELASFPVRYVLLGTETRLSSGILSVDAAELRAILLADDRFADVAIDVVRPGEAVRIVHIVDAVEPRARIGSPGADFPGLLSKPHTAGSGRTHRLDGVAVVETAEPVPGEASYWREAVVDMRSEAAPYSPLASVNLVVLTLTPNPRRFGDSAAGAVPENLFGGTPEAIEYNLAVRKAGLKTAVYLAEVTRDLAPARVDQFGAAPDTGAGLPKVVYVMQALPYIYGEVAPGVVGHAEAGFLPTIIHPAEVLDGALVNSFNPPACMREATYLLQNNAVIRDLHERHGTDLEFAGVVLYTYGDTEREKERTTSYVANLARLLGADGAVLTTLGGGHPSVDAMMVVEKLERLGIKTALLLMEMASKPGDSGFVHYVAEADAIVSTGNYEQTLRTPACRRVLGGSRLFGTGEDASGPLELTLRHYLGSTSQFGGGSIRGRAY
jgi:glycine reductase